MSEFNRSLAVVIGINNYQNGIDPLQTAVPDAVAIAEVLQKNYKYQLIHPDFDSGVIIDRYAAKAKLKSLLTDILPKQIQPRDRLIFYFAGHGIARNSDLGPEGYLVPQDADLKQQDSLLKMSEVHDLLSQLKCKHLLVVLDCCFAGTFRWASYRKLIPIAEEITKAHYDRFLRFPAFQVLTSASHNQEALDFINNRDAKSDRKHSPFAQGLIEALQQEKGDLNGDGVIIATELYLYLRDYVELNSQDRQTPGFFPLKKHDRGEYLFELPNTPLKLKETPPLDKDNNPYRGLEPFEEKHARLFFGREEIISQLAAKICQTTEPLTVVTGISGSGKSSLVKAGLIPYLRENESKWQILEPIRPGTNPFAALARILSQLDRNSVQRAGDTKLMGDRLQASSHEFVETVRIWNRHHPDRRLLLVIDQFEELITMASKKEPKKPEPESRFARFKNRLGWTKPESDPDLWSEKTTRWQDFIQLLAEILEQCPQLSLVITLRSDFEPRFQESAFGSNWAEARFVVPPMRSDELRDAVEKPAAEKALYFEPPELVDRLVDEVALMPGALPLLSFTLSEMYVRLYQAWIEEGKEDRALTVAEDFNRRGGVIGTLTRRANEEYRHLPSPKKAYRSTMRKVMLRMVELEGGEAVKRRVLASELVYSDDEENQRKEEVLSRLLKARLIVTGTDPEADEQYYEPAHDFLVKGWQKLQVWISAEQADLALQRLLTPTVVAWNRERNNIDLWDANSRLDRLREIYSSQTAEHNWLNQIESEFLQKSVAKKKNRQTRTISIFTTVTVALTTLTGAALFSLRNAIIGEISSLIQASDASFNSNQKLEAFRLAIEASNNLANSNFLGNKLLTFFPLKNTDNRIKKVLYQSHGQNLLRNELQGHDNEVTNAEFSPDGEYIVTSSRDTTAILWTEKGEFVANLNGHREMVNNAKFSPDGEYIVTSSSNGTAKLWTKTGDFLTTITYFKNRYSVNRAEFSPDGKYILTSLGNSTATVWNTAEVLKSKQDFDDAPIATIGIYNHERTYQRQATFSPDGKYIITVSQVNNPSENTSEIITEIWTVDGKLISTIEGSGKFSSDGRFIFLVINPNLVEILETDKVLQGNEGLLAAIEDEKIDDVYINPNGDFVVTSYEDRDSFKVWEITNDSSKIEYIATLEKASKTIEFSSDGLYMVTTSQDGSTGKVWTNRGMLISTFQENGTQLQAAKFSKDARFILTFSSSSSGIVKIWNREESSFINLNHQNNQDKINSAKFSSDGDFLITSSEGVARLWDTQKTLNAEDDSIATYQGHNDRINSIEFSPDEKYVLTSSSDSTARLWTRNGKLITVYEAHEGEVNQAKFSPDGNFILTTSSPDFRSDPNNRSNAVNAYDRTAKVWQRDGTLVGTIGDKDSGYTVGSAKFSPDGRWVVTASSANNLSDDNNAKVWSMDGSLLATLKDSRSLDNSTDNSIPTVDAEFSPNGEYIVTAAFDGTVKIWSTANIDSQEKTAPIASFKSHSDRVFDVEFSSDGEYFVTASADTTAKIWNLAKVLQNQIAPISTLSGHKQQLESAKFSTDGKFIVTDSFDGTVKIWIVEETTGRGNLFATFNTYNGIPKKTQMSSDGNSIVTISFNGKARLWDLRLDSMTTEGCKQIENYLKYNDNAISQNSAVCEGILSDNN